MILSANMVSEPNYLSALMAPTVVPAPISSVSSTNTDDSVPSVYAPSHGHDHSFHLTIHKLNGKNYVAWAQSVKLVIDGKGKLGHLTGELVRPADGDPGLPAWKSINSMVIAWLINSMEPTIGKT